MFWSKSLIPSLKEEPQEAEIISHKLMIRAGMLRKLTSGIYNFLPLGLKVLHKIANIVREEMDKSGAQELLLATLQPRQIWDETGRWSIYGDELVRIVDRHKRDFCLGPTHEEVITDLVRKEIRSYRQLPQTFYQIQTKFRDEIRPRFGIMRCREFSMKDAYSFDSSYENAEKTYWKMIEVYKNIFTRCNLNFKAVEADPGQIGGNFSHEFMVIANVGEEKITFCNNCNYSANIENAECFLNNEIENKEDFPLEEIYTPNKKTVEEVAFFLNCSTQNLLKTLLYQYQEKYYAVLIRGDRELNETKLKKVLNLKEITLVESEKIQELTNSPCGFTGPVKLKEIIKDIIIVGDQEISLMKNMITGANKIDTHFINVNVNRDFNVDILANIKKVKKGDLCINCQQELQFAQGIEVGHTFMLGTKYSQAMKAFFLNEIGEEKPIIMGCYGIGIGRTLAASIEQNHDDYGIIWPLALAPYQVLILPVNVQETQQMELALKLYYQFKDESIEVLLDDRDIRGGIKFNDADLIGIPFRITIGSKSLKEGNAEIKIRKTGEIIKVKIDEVRQKIKELIEKG
ncbi:MAG: proline--tRNA ligase [bacterium]